MINQSFEENMLRMRLQYLRDEFSDLLSRKNEMICHEENQLLTQYLNLFGQPKYEIYCLKVEIAMLNRRKEYVSQLSRRNRTIDLKAVDEEVKRLFGKYLKKMEEDALKLAAAREHVKNNPFESEQIKRASELYRAIIPHIHPRIYKESCARCVDFLAQTNSAYITMDIAALEKIADMTANIEKDDVFVNVLEFRKFVEKIETKVENLKIKLERMNLVFPFNQRALLQNPDCIAAEQKKLNEDIEKLEIEKIHATDELVLCQLWKHDSLN